MAIFSGYELGTRATARVAPTVGTIIKMGPESYHNYRRLQDAEIKNRLFISPIYRTAKEDQVLATELTGYSTYAGQVRYRLIPGVW